jgi:hypothetical protein
LIQSQIIDLEVVESIFEAAKTIFKQYPACKPSSTALAALEELRKADYSTLGMAMRYNTEHAIADLSETSNITAADLFAAMAAVLSGEKTGVPSMHSRQIRLRFLKKLAKVWLQGGLKPSRVIHPERPAYKSSFHRYADLILTAMAEPWAKRHSDGAVLETLRRDLWVAHSRPPVELRPHISAGLRRADREWLIVDEYLRDALRGAIQISDCKIP